MRHQLSHFVLLVSIKLFKFITIGVTHLNLTLLLFKEKEKFQLF